MYLHNYHDWFSDEDDEIIVPGCTAVYLKALRQGYVIVTAKYKYKDIDIKATVSQILPSNLRACCPLLLRSSLMLNYLKYKNAGLVFKTVRVLIRRYAVVFAYNIAWSQCVSIACFLYSPWLLRSLQTFCLQDFLVTCFLCLISFTFYVNVVLFL